MGDPKSTPEQRRLARAFVERRAGIVDLDELVPVADDAESYARLMETREAGELRASRDWLWEFCHEAIATVEEGDNACKLVVQLHDAALASIATAADNAALRELVRAFDAYIESQGGADWFVAWQKVLKARATIAKAADLAPEPADNSTQWASNE